MQKIFEGQRRKWQIRKCKLDSLIFHLVFKTKSYHMVLGMINPTNLDVHRSKTKLASYFMGLPCMVLQ
jgi:hypothetical protein